MSDDKILKLIDDKIFADDGVDRVVPPRTGKVLGVISCLAVGLIIGFILSYHCIVWTIDHMLIEAGAIR